MPNNNKYIGLINYLKSISNKNVTLTFTDIEKLIGDTLPSSAYNRRAFWANTRTHSVAFGWLDASYRRAAVDFTNQQVEFVKR